MRCSCDQARRAAQAEAFADAALIAECFEWWRHSTAAPVAVHKRVAEAIRARARAASAPSGPHPIPAPERASSTPPSAATEDDGFITVHATDWPDNPMEGGAL
jgi:hypothetical protein